MKIKIILNRHISPSPPKLVAIQDFADEHGLVMEIHERVGNQRPEARFYAYFQGVGTIDGHMLVSEHGNGETPKIAVCNYVSAISGKKLRLSDKLIVEAPLFTTPTNLDIPA